MNLQCDIDKAKICPQKAGHSISGAGVIECSSQAYFDCCRCKEQFKQAHKCKRGKYEQTTKT